MQTNTTQKLPFLPGCTFTDPTVYYIYFLHNFIVNTFVKVSDFKKGQTFNYKNGTRNCDSSLPRGTASTKLASTSADLYAKPAAGEQYIPSWVCNQFSLIGRNPANSATTNRLYLISKCLDSTRTSKKWFMTVLLNPFVSDW